MNRQGAIRGLGLAVVLAWSGYVFILAAHNKQGVGGNEQAIVVGLGYFGLALLRFLAGHWRLIALLPGILLLPVSLYLLGVPAIWGRIVGGLTIFSVFLDVAFLLEGLFKKAPTSESVTAWNG